MKLLHIITSFEIGGAQRLLSDLIPIQVSQGFDVSVAVNRNIDNAFSKKLKDSGIRIIEIGKENFYNPKNILLLRKLLRNYDIAHVHLFPTLYWAAFANIGLSTKLVYTEHSTYNKRRDKRWLQPIEKIVYSRYNKIISISSQTQTNLMKWLGFNDDRFIIIDNGVDIASFKSTESRNASKSLIMVSRFVAAKDQSTLIKAMKRIDSTITLRLVGDGDNLDSCKKLADEEGVDGRVQFLGNRTDIPQLISESYIGIQSSNWEGFGLTAIEIMAAGKPVVASDVDGLKQVVEGAGLIFKKGDHIDLANCINRLLEDEDLYRSTSEKCMERAARYDISKMAAEYSKVYNAVMAR